jgi:hypothetical protein
MAGLRHQIRGRPRLLWVGGRPSPGRSHLQKAAGRIGLQDSGRSGIPGLGHQQTAATGSLLAPRSNRKPITRTGPRSGRHPQAGSTLIDSDLCGSGDSNDVHIGVLSSVRSASVRCAPAARSAADVFNTPAAHFCIKCCEQGGCSRRARNASLCGSGSQRGSSTGRPMLTCGATGTGAAPAVSSTMVQAVDAP